MKCDDLTPKLVRVALAGDGHAQRRLIERLTPEIQHSVYRMLRRWRTGPAAGRDLRQELEDLTQEVWLELFKHDCRVLRRWDPERGNLSAYVSHVAKIRTAGFLRSRLSPWREDPRQTRDLDRDDPDEDPEGVVAAKHLLQAILLCLYARFTVADSQLFDLLILGEALVEVAAERTSRTIGAIYKWRSRLYGWADDCRNRLSK